MHRVMIIGAGKVGETFLSFLIENSFFSLHVVCIVDINSNAQGLRVAAKYNIPTFSSWKNPFFQSVDIIIDATNNQLNLDEIYRDKDRKITVIPSYLTSIIAKLMENQNPLIHKIEKKSNTMLEAIIYSSDEAISVVDEKGYGLLVNPAYTRITGLSKEDIIGKPAATDIYEGESMHMQVLKTKKPVRGVNMRVGPKKKEVIVNVAPIIVDGELKGSVGVIQDVSEIQKLTSELRQARRIIRTLQAHYLFDDIIADSDVMKIAIEQAKLSAQTPATVLLRGESGTGKELFAHAIHNASERKFNKFVRVNCAAVSETLLESELFGYDEGAFTGAKRGGKIGYFEEANNGSIFLDEIGELSPKLQAKLLRVIQDHEIIRVGSTTPIPINVRIIAATNVDLEDSIKKGTFREDLYFRLNRIPIYIAPLRSRKEDIKGLADYLIQKINQEYGRNIEGITEQAICKLQDYNWPGNVRELENILGRAVIFMRTNEVMIDVDHIPNLNTIDSFNKSESPETKKVHNHNLAEAVALYEQTVIKEALQAFHGNKTLTAKALGISIRSLYYKLDKMDICK